MTKLSVKRVCAQSTVYYSIRAHEGKKNAPGRQHQVGVTRTNHELNSALRPQAISTLVSERLDQLHCETLAQEIMIR